ncbi:MAG: replication-associated recombination protein A [Rhabdochlamydiaceae bacterium]|nr:replication-associated recombination protein A [Rhabdochlamydiaceae bacterium]
MTKKPLAEELRPSQLSQFFGQNHLLHQHGLIPSTLENKNPLSLLLWGPPGCGKTSLARIYIRSFTAQTFYLHPATQGIPELKKWIQDIESMPLLYKQNILFIDEIHRLNKTQQDALLPFLEKGTFSLIGATTENPSFHLTSALLSRLRILTLKALDDDALKNILERALLHTHLDLTEEAKIYFLQEAKGDARHLLNNVESLLSRHSEKPLTIEEVSQLLSIKAPLYDASGDQHYQLISALHKSIRGSDPDAALYWITRMLQAGEDRDFIARRLLRIAVEDIGLADPKAQQITLMAWQTFERLGAPEGDLALAEAAIFLALSPKSNASYTAMQAAQKLAEQTSHLPPPPHLINASTSLLRKMGYGKDYLYDHDTPEGFSGQDYFPENVERQNFYHPKERGEEREMKKRKDYFAKLRDLLKKRE